MTKKLLEIASEIVQTQVSANHMSAAEIAASLRQVFNTLQEIQKAETGGTDIEIALPGSEASAEESTTPKLSPEDSIQNDKVICLECGAEMKQLTKKHLASHGMDHKAYKKRYGFTMKTALAAKSVTKLRSKIAKKRGLPENLQKLIDERRKIKAEAATKVTAVENVEASKPKRTRLRKKKAV